MKKSLKKITCICVSISLISIGTQNGIISAEEKNIFEERIENMQLNQFVMNNEQQPDEVIADVNVQTGSCGANARWEYHIDTKILTISGTGAIDDNYRFDREIDEVIIEEGITNIGSTVFWKAGIKKIQLPSSLESVGYGTFWGCSKLTEINIPKSFKNMGQIAFEKCCALKNITVDEENQDYSSENGVLYNKAKTKLILYPAGREEDSFSIPNTVTELGEYAFDYNQNLKYIGIPAMLTSLGSEVPFTEICKVEDFYVEDENQEYCSVDGSIFSKDISRMIHYAVGKNDIAYEVPKGVNTVGEDAFCYAASLESVTFPSTVKKIENGALDNCTSIKKITVLNPNCDMNYIFSSLRGLSDLVIEGYQDSTAYAYATEKGLKFVESKIPYEPESETESVTAKEPETESVTAKEPETQSVTAKEPETQSDTASNIETESGTTIKEKTTTFTTKENIFVGKAKIKNAKIKKLKLKLSIYKLGNVNGYELQISKDKKFKKILLKKKTSKINISIKFKKIAKYKIVFVRVRGYRKVQNKIIKGKWSKAIKVKRK
ncbi:MAG: leucine-rich repeat protein [Lachnospiraceae bacterium]|nr:leucine-rich repeat protein [Lachnospiraceae bacterium]